MRILLLNDNFPPETMGGSGRVVAEASAALAARGHEVSVLTASEHEAWPYPDTKVTVRTVRKLPQRWAHYRSVFSRRREQDVVSVIDEVQPDLIHAHGIAWQIGYRWIAGAKARGIPCVYTIHGMMHISYGKITGLERWLWWHDLRRARWTLNPLRNVCIRWALSRMDRIFCVSDAVKNLMETRGFPRLQTLHNGVDTNFWHPLADRTGIRQSLSLPLDRPVFLLSGRLGYDKGLQLLLGLWPQLRGEPHLVLAGRVPGVSSSFHERIHVLGPQNREQMRQLYTAVDVNLVPSLCFDCFPTTSLESMACGRPVIVGNRGGGREAVLEGETGWVVDPSNPEAVRERIQYCVDHAEELDDMGQRARRHMETSFSLDGHIETLLQEYSVLCSSSA